MYGLFVRHRLQLYRSSPLCIQRCVQSSVPVHNGHWAVHANAISRTHTFDGIFDSIFVRCAFNSYRAQFVSRIVSYWTRIAYGIGQNWRPTTTCRLTIRAMPESLIHVRQTRVYGINGSSHTDAKTKAFPTHSTFERWANPWRIIVLFFRCVFSKKNFICRLHIARIRNTACRWLDSAEANKIRWMFQVANMRFLLSPFLQTGNMSTTLHFLWNAHTQSSAPRQVQREWVSQSFSVEIPFDLFFLFVQLPALHDAVDGTAAVGVRA